MSQQILRRRFPNQAPPTGRTATAATGRAQQTRWSVSWMLKGTNWSIAFLAFLVYIFVVVSFQLPIGTAAMATTLVTFGLEGKPLRVPAAARWALVLLAWALIGWPVSDYRDVVANGLLDFAKVCTVLLVAINVISTRNRLRVVLLVLLATFALYPVRGALFSYFIYGGNNMGRAAWNFIYLNSNDLAGFCLLMFSLGAGVLITERTMWVRLSAAAGMAVLPFLVLLTGSRAGFIALCVFVLVAFGKSVLELRKLLMVLAVGAVVVFFIPDNLWRRLATIRDVGHASARSSIEYESSTAQRLEIWKVARTVIFDHPVMGVGLGAYPSAHFEYAQRSEFDPTAQGYRDAHSTYLRLAGELGWIGLVIFCAMVAATVRDAERARRLAKKAHPRLARQLVYMELGLAAYLVAGIWASWGTLVFTYLHLALINAAANLLRMEMMPPPPARVPRGMRPVKSSTVALRSS